jgi:cytochrome c553
MTKTTLLSLVAGMVVFVVSTALSAATSGDTIAVQGNGKGAAPCMSCHGDKGQGNPAAAYPYLAGQSAAYLVKQLEDFASKRRSNPVMQPVASALSAEEIKAVADYYSHLPLPKTSTSQKDAALAKAGETLAVNGKWSRGMPACFKCHGDKGQGVAPHFPAISGQSSAYLKKQLQSWQKGERSNDPGGLMQAVIKHLNESEIAGVADYLAAQSPTTRK